MNVLEPQRRGEWRLPRVALLATILFALLPIGATAAPKLGAREMALARDYVFAACIMQRYPKTPLASEADAWAAALVEQGSLRAEDYPTLARWASKAPQPGITSDGVVMHLQSCVDFVNARNFLTDLQHVLRRPARRR